MYVCGGAHVTENLEKFSKCQNRDISRPETKSQIFPDIVSGRQISSYT